MLNILVVVVALVVIVLAVLVASLLRSHAEILRALHGLGINLDPAAAETDADVEALVAPPSTSGSPGAVDLAGVTPFGDPVTVAVAGVEHLTLLAFLSSTCLTCRGFWDDFADPRLVTPGRARLVVVTKGPDAESPSALQALAPANRTVVGSSAAWADYGVPVAPYFILVDGPSARVVGEGAAASWGHVAKLLGSALDDRDAIAGRK